MTIKRPFLPKMRACSTSSWITWHKIDDMAISVRTKGPLFIIYPFDSKPELKASKYYGRSAWQLKSIKVE